MLYVGIDWRDKDHCVFVTDDFAGPLLAFRFEHTAQGLAEFQRRLAQHGTNPATVLCAIELKSGLLVDSLLHCGYQVYHTPPKPSAATGTATIPAADLRDRRRDGGGFGSRGRWVEGGGWGGGSGHLGTIASGRRWLILLISAYFGSSSVPVALTARTPQC